MNLKMVTVLYSSGLYVKLIVKFYLLGILSRCVHVFIESTHRLVKPCISALPSKPKVET